MEYQGLILDREAGVATLTLNRPEQLNALTQTMFDSIVKILGEVDRDSSLKALIITGAGRGFSAGLDVSAMSELSRRSQEGLGDLMRSITLGVSSFSKPSIAAINGVAAGGGLAIALLCDIRIASEKARFTSGYIRMGLTPDLGSTYNWPRIVGTAKAMEVLLTGDMLDAAEAFRIGLVNRVVPEGDLMKTTRELADRIAAGPSIATELTKKAIKESSHNSLEQQVDVECSAFYTCLRTQDHKEGAKAFLEKRQPRFEGR